MILKAHFIHFIYVNKDDIIHRKFTFIYSYVYVGVVPTGTPMWHQDGIKLDAIEVISKLKTSTSMYGTFPMSTRFDLRQQICFFNFQNFKNIVLFIDLHQVWTWCPFSIFDSYVDYDFYFYVYDGLGARLIFPSIKPPKNIEVIKVCVGTTT